MPLINYSANRIEALGDNRFGGTQRGTLSNITASVTSSCVNFEDTGFISMSGITGGRGPAYNYSLFDVSASAFITQSTAISSAIISNLSNSTYSLNISNEGVFAYTQSIIVSCPPPPPLSIEYLVVGGGGRTAITGFGGGAGGFLSSSFSASYNSIFNIVVGLGAPTGSSQGGTSSISSSTLFVSASGGDEGDSGGPTLKIGGLGGPPPIGKGGGAGAGANGINGVDGSSGNGGNGLLWLDGNYYAGGGGGGANATVPANNGDGGLGGGGRGEPGGCTICLSGSNGVDGTGGGAGGGNFKGGNGIVIIRYSTGSVRPAYGGTVTEQGGYIYHTFTGSGEFRYAKS
jgi:hypothetical protein